MNFKIVVKCADCNEEMDIENFDTFKEEMTIEVRPCKNCPTIVQPAITIPVPEVID